MTDGTVKHKLKVFISSKCGGKYEIARKALEKLLIETGLVECYCFETEPGSSESMPSAYLNYVYLSQLLLLLVDNKDDITPATMSEYKKAKELNLRILVVFCNERKKKKTEVQKEIESTYLCKYAEVTKFSDIVECAYTSVMQDILGVYMNIHTDTESENEVIVPEIQEKSIVPNAHQVDRKFYNEFNATKDAIVNSIYKVGKKEEQQLSEIDTMFRDFMQVILYNSDFDANLFAKLKPIILSKHNDIVYNVVDKRLEAISYYFVGDIDNCIKLLTEIVEDSNIIANAPQWLVNDVAVDLRNMINSKDEKEGGVYTIDNKGQHILDLSTEYVYFPAIDRIASNIKKNIIKEYSKIALQSPYTNSLGGLDFLFTDVASYYCTALLYGSITHLRITRSYIIEILQVLSQEYSNQEFNAQLIKFLILEADYKKLTDIVRTYDKPYDIVNSIEIEKIITGISYLPTEYDKAYSTLLLLRYFGYYLSDEQFKKQIEWFYDYSCSWIKNKNRIFNFNEEIKKVYQNCCERIPSKKTANFIIKLFNSKNYRL